MSNTKDIILQKVKETSTEQLIDFLKKQGVSSWKLNLATRDQIITGIEKELSKYTDIQLKEFHDRHFG